MRIELHHTQTNGGLLVPDIRFTERPCLCPVCTRPGLLLRILTLFGLGPRTSKGDRDQAFGVRTLEGPLSDSRTG